MGQVSTLSAQCAHTTVCLEQRQPTRATVSALGSDWHTTHMASVATLSTASEATAMPLAFLAMTRFRAAAE